MSTPLVIDYYSDVLCVWAWIAQRRLEELHQQWGDSVAVHHHYLNLFGDTSKRIGQQWADRGGFDGFGQHVRDAAAPYENAPVSKTIWQQVRPQTSANAHLLLKATELAYSREISSQLATALREAFFVSCSDIGQMPVLLTLAKTADLDPDQLQALIANGAAMSALMADYKAAQDLALQGSPTWIMNNGRQILYGNVGYRVLHANIEEILKRPEQEASWC